MTYASVLIYDTDGGFIGYAIKGATKLQSTNIYLESEEADLDKRLLELNTSADLSKHWPHPRDPDVITLLDSPAFEPLETHLVEVVDIENSPHVIYKQMADPEVHGAWIDTEAIDEEQSTLAYKMVRVPVRPTDQVKRIKAACELVARHRANATIG